MERKHLPTQAGTLILVTRAGVTTAITPLLFVGKVEAYETHMGYGLRMMRAMNAVVSYEDEGGGRGRWQHALRA